jgi:two-component system, LytTR family, response regulator
MIRAILADDEALSRRALEQMLVRHPDIEIVARCDDGAAASDAIATLRPDVAFLDIKMPLASGLEVAHMAGGRPLVVFVTAFDRFAVPAFALDAADYVVKPLTEERFDATLARVRERLRARDALAIAASPATPRLTGVSQLIARVGMTELIIPTATIQYACAEDVYAMVTCSAGRYLVRTPLNQLQRLLGGGAFLRVHRSCIVRIDCVVAVRRRAHGGMDVVMADGAKLPVSRRRRASLRRLLSARSSKSTTASR